MSLLVLDTDAAPALMLGRAPAALAASVAGRVPAITFVTLGELTTWTLIRRWGPRRLAAMRRFVAALVVLPYDDAVAHRWGEIQAFARLRGRPRPASDAWIAACCLTRELPLATFNLRDFEDFAQHEGLELVASR